MSHTAAPSPEAAGATPPASAAPPAGAVPRTPRDLLRELRRWHRPLMLMVAAMAVLVVVSTAGMIVDGRELNGVSVWDKPWKFGVSFVLYGTTLAWMIGTAHRARRFLHAAGTLVAVSGFCDVAVIAVQGARGTYSHFNMSPDVYAATANLVFAVGVPILLLANLAAAVVLIAQRAGDRATAFAFRAAAAFSVIGMLGGVLIAANPDGRGGTYIDGNGDAVPMVTRHSVGVRDDGPVMSFVGWSTTGGDLRIAHFLGIHGMQFVLLTALLLTVLATRAPRLRDDRTRRALIAVAGAGYLGVTVIAAWQALRGQALIHPDGATLAAVAAVAALTAAGVAAALLAGRRRAAGRSSEALQA